MKSFQNNLLPYDGEVYLIKNYIINKDLKENIKSEVEWRNDKIQMFGKFYEQKRKVAWHGEKEIQYIYSRIKMISPGWTESLKNLCAKINNDYGFSLNSVLVNLYRNGEDHMSWHRDNEPELGQDPIIVSLSLGVNRDFYLRHNDGTTIKLELGDGDLLIMQGKTQSFWKHSLPKRKKITKERLNLTFRQVLN